MKNLFDSIANDQDRLTAQPAFFIDNHTYTYENLFQEVARLEVLIQSLRLYPQEVVVVVTNDDLTTYAAILTLWKLGLVYLPIHPDHPKSRNKDIISDAAARLVLTSRSDVSGIPDAEVVVDMNMEVSVNLTLPALQVKPDPTQNLAYILYTSGSTGKPKGVQITHSNFLAFIDSFEALGLGLSERDRCLQCFDITFDVGIQCFVLPLVHGACVYTVPHDVMKFSYVYELLEDQEITFGVFAPSMIKLLRPYFDDIRLNTLRVCILTAEASPVDLIREWQDCIPKARVINLYGPTECTVYCTGYDIGANQIHVHNGKIAIGSSFRHVECIVVDEHRQEVKPGRWGELCLAGDQLTPGYYKNETLNQEKFFLHRGKRFYLTGDQCRWEGEVLIYGGRLDNQVKLQGFRVELGEVEHRIQDMVKKEVVAIAYEDKQGTTKLGLCMEGTSEEGQELMERCKTQLPAYMIPARILSLEAFPLNVNQKLDRKVIASKFQ